MIDVVKLVLHCVSNVSCACNVAMISANHSSSFRPGLATLPSVG